MLQVKLGIFILIATSFNEFAIFFFWYELYQTVKPKVTSLCSRVQGTQMSKNPVTTESISHTDN